MDQEHTIELIYDLDAEVWSAFLDDVELVGEEAYEAGVHRISSLVFLVGEPAGDPGPNVSMAFDKTILDNSELPWFVDDLAVTWTGLVYMDEFESGDLGSWSTVVN